MPQRSTRRAAPALVVVSGLVIVGAIVLWQARNATVREPPSGPSVALAAGDDGALRAWNAVLERHPHARTPGWELQPGTTLTPTDYIPNGRVYFFMRVLAGNGASSLDYAQVRLADEKVVGYEHSVQPEQLASELEQPPVLTTEEAWARAVEELRACGCAIEATSALSSDPHLRLEKDGPGARLVFAFFPEGSKYAVSVDVCSGDVGRLRPTFFGGIYADDDPLTPTRRPEDGHDIERLRSGWVATARPANGIG